MRRLLLALFCLSATPALAHDFWIDIPRYRQDDARDFSLQFLIGDTSEIENWVTRWHKIVSLQSIGPDGTVTDQQQHIATSTGEKAGGASIALKGAGTHVIAFVSNPSESDLPAAEFNAYAEHEGLTPAIDKRKADGTSDQRGRELYARRAKALVQIGDTPTDQVTRPVGLTLEIVPEKNPYALGAQEPLTVRVYYRGQPLAGASLALEPLHRPASPGTPVVTDAQGRATFSFEKKGEWRIALVWTQPVNHPKAEFDTLFSSMTFGY